MATIMKTAADDKRTCTEDEATEHDVLDVEVKSIDGDLVRWRGLEKLQVTTATPVPIVAAGLRTSAFWRSRCARTSSRASRWRGS